MHIVGNTSTFLLQGVLLIGWMAASVLGCIPRYPIELWPNSTLSPQSQDACVTLEYVRCGEYIGCCCCPSDRTEGIECVMDGGERSYCCSKCFEYEPNRVPTEIKLPDGAYAWNYCDPECCCADPDCAAYHGAQFKCQRYKFSPAPASTLAAKTTTDAVLVQYHPLCEPLMSSCTVADVCCGYGDWPGNCFGGVCVGLQTWAPCANDAECWSGHCTAVVGSYGGRCDFGAAGSFCNKTDSGLAYCKSGTCGADAENPGASYGKCA